MKKWIIIAVAVIVVSVVGYPLLFVSKKEAPQDKSAITTKAAASRGDLLISIAATGKIEPIKTVELRSKASGEIMKMLAEEGDLVKKNQMICELEKTTAQNDFEQAQADLEVAEINLQTAEKDLKRQKELYAQKLISDQELEASQLTFQQAKSQKVRAQALLSTAAERLEDTVIRSPMDGIIVQKYVEEGMVIASGISSVSGGTLIALVGDLNSVYVQADVDETDIGKVQLGQPVKVRPDAYPNQEFVGSVLRISPQGTEVQNVTTFRVTAEVTNPEQLLRAGMNATVEIIASDLKNVLLVPAEAVHEQKDVMRLMALVDKEDNQKARAGLRPGNGSPNTKYVLVLKDGVPTPVSVQVGSVSFDYAEIKSGLSEGDSVLTVSVSQMMQEREEFKDRMKERRQIPGVKKSG